MSSSSNTTIPDIALLSPYNYVPTEWICILILVLFIISTCAHAVEATIFRIWWLFPTAVLSGIMEILGWSGRVWSSRNPILQDPFLMQICMTIIGPTPLLAANFVLLGQIIPILGSQYSRLTAKTYTIVFCTCDVTALVIQAAGGGIAASATDEQGTKLGANIMLAGIAIQLVAIVIYMALATEILVRYSLKSPVRDPAGASPWASTSVDAMDTRLKLMVSGLGMITIFLLIRSIYRLIELSDGWNGRIISTQVYFNVLDGGMVILATYTLNFFHPGFLLRPEHKGHEYTSETTLPLEKRHGDSTPKVIA
ncbi:lipid-translocating exporter [Heterobasidion irregulare TC 32-1]|uniref:Lipid-translocating exporter n=1 Tax=Heterobasidion irregulare (strain TC 32-1) TaxID=747525 RepID=W4JTX8_HETIT|nr:lipid-translocating exporter [Heterobasidion irregulare TC 32-1]ETW76316.1 lipid-translocating exporter [Heterobasidion irregulare TC 32-1]